MRVFEAVIPLRWGDMDAMNHLNNTLYFRLMEETRIRWFWHHGLNAGPDGEGPILAHATCDFIKPLTYPGDAFVTHTVTRIGKASMGVDVTIERTDERGVIYAKGKNILVWMDYRSGKTSPWPEPLRRAIGLG
jgi:acyl-CoA thioester hydrolase